MRNGSVTGNDVQLPSPVGRRNFSVYSKPRTLGVFAGWIVFSAQHETDTKGQAHACGHIPRAGLGIVQTSVIVHQITRIPITVLDLNSGLKSFLKMFKC